MDELDELQQELKDCLYGCQQRLFQRFYHQHYDTCLFLIAALAEVDVLASFALVSFSGSSQFGRVPPHEAFCRPVFVASGGEYPVPCSQSQEKSSVDPSDRQTVSPFSASPKSPPPPILRLINSRHPIVAHTLSMSSGRYVPNDVCLGDPEDPSGSDTY